LLPNDRAIEPQAQAAYRFGLNARQIELVSRATPKRQYYLQSARGNRLFELGLGPVALALCGSSDPDSQKRIDAILAEHGAEDFRGKLAARRGARLGPRTDCRLCLTLIPRRFVPRRRRKCMKTLAAALLTATLIPMAIDSVPPAYAVPVFDSANYSQNLLTAARTLQQINQQIQSLQNEAQVLANQQKHLSKIDFPQLSALQQRLQEIDRLMGQAQGIDFRVDRLDEQFRQAFPTSFDHLARRDTRIAAAKERLENEMAAYRQTMSIQSGIVENVRGDTEALRAILDRSQSAEGGLQAAQATNQLLALAAKQQFQIQQLMAAQFRAEALERAARAQIAREARESTRRFLGDGKAWTPPR
jgi:P-type conjugative transfer protein TrbJ